MVVPPDLLASQLGGGPIVLATDLDKTSIPAARLAAELARRLDRELVALHVDSASYDAATIAPEAIAVLGSLPQRTLDDVAGWIRANELVSADPLLARGERLGTILSTARAREAAFIVCGSRCLSTTERIFASSTASELARRADRPVLVVPHE
jgi:nucleotide-binding universal stress UspA family protein